MLTREEKMRKNIFLIRGDSDDQGTIGRLMSFEDDFSCYTIELPWRDNMKSISCIPDGMYVCEIRQSPKFGTTFHVTNVEGRKYVLMHSGNFAGDVYKGYKTHSHGCILLGRKAVVMCGQKAVTNSRTTMGEFMRVMGADEFNLHIINNKTW